MRSPYRALGLTPGADDDQIKSAFRQLAKQSHPDVNTSESASGERFKEIHKAYRLLHDPQMRAILDDIIAEVHAATRRRWLMAMATMTAVFILTVGGGLLFAIRVPIPDPQMSMHQAPATAEGKTLASAERQRPANGENAKSSRELAEVAGVEKQGTARRAPAATPAGAVLVKKPPVSDEHRRLAEAVSSPTVASAAAPAVKEAKSADEPASSLVAAEERAAVTPKKKQAQVQTPGTLSASVGAQAEGDSLAKPPAPVEGAIPSGATTWGAALVIAPPKPEELAKWSTYRNERFGFSLKYPSRVFAVAKGGGDDKVLLVSHDGRARLRVTGTPFNRTITTLPAYRQRLIAKQYSDVVFDRTPVHKTWFALAGRRGDKSFYARVVCACDARSLHTWELTYPPSERAFYESVAEEIRRSYRREGEDMPGHCRRRGQAQRLGYRHRVALYCGIGGSAT
jgi:hypothetical protein